MSEEIPVKWEVLHKLLVMVWWEHEEIKKRAEPV
jgi:hypothetical protein